MVKDIEGYKEMKLKGCFFLLIKIFLIIVFLVIVACLVLDYINFPFYPIDLINKYSQIEIVVKINDTREDIEKLMEKEGGVKIEIYRAQDIERIENTPPYKVYHTDVLGRLKIFLPRGKYFIKARIYGLKALKLIKYTIPDPKGYFLIVNKDKMNVELTLEPQTKTSFKEKKDRIDKLIFNGKFKDAFDFVNTTVLFTEDKMQKTLLLKYRDILKKINALSDSLKELSANSYNTKIMDLQQILDLLKSLYPRDDIKKFRIFMKPPSIEMVEKNSSSNEHEVVAEDIPAENEGYSIIIVDYIEAIRKARDYVINYHLKNLREFLKEKKKLEGKKYFEIKADREKIKKEQSIISPYETLIKFYKDPELYNPEEKYSPEIQRQLKDIEQLAEELKEEVIDLIEEIFNEAKFQYEKGKFSESRKLFARLNRYINIFKDELEYSQVMKLKVAEYLHDIAKLDFAESEFIQNNYQKALEYYMSVINKSDWIKRRIKEIQSYL